MNVEAVGCYQPGPLMLPEEDEPGHVLESPADLRYGSKTIVRYVNVLIDRWFKVVFGAERNKEALIGLLRELIPERSIADVSYNRRKKRKNSPFEGCRDAVFDVECTDESGARFVVEMQMAEQEHFYNRALFYSTFPIQEQVLASNVRERHPHDCYFDYPPVYVISFLNFAFHEGSEKILYRYDLRERESGERMTDRVNFLYLEMPNAGEREPEAGDSFARKLSWAFTHMSILRERPAGLLERVFEKIFEACEVAALEETEQQKYKEDMTTKWDLHDQLSTAWHKGNREGLEAGMQRGRAEGREEGARAMQQDIAQRLKALGFSDTDIAAATGLE